MTFEKKEAYVWIWLPESTEPVVAGRLVANQQTIDFNYGKTYLARQQQNQAISIYEPELPLQSGELPLLNGLSMPSCIRGCVGCVWGRCVILNKILSRKGRGADMTELDELTYLLESGSDRIGALDFQSSASEYAFPVTPTIPQSVNC